MREEISIYDDSVYQMMERLYEIHHGEWKKNILQWFVSEKSKIMSSQTIKAHLMEVPELLIDRCLWDLEHGEVLEHIHLDNELCYHLKKSHYADQILNDICENARISQKMPLKKYAD